MSGSTSLLDLLSSQQLGKDVTANDLFNADSPAALFGRRGSLCSGLNWFYYGGQMVSDGSLAGISNNAAALVLTASSNNYIEADRAGAVTTNTTGFTPGRIPLYLAVTGASTVTSYTDYRSYKTTIASTSKGTETVTAADVTMSAATARCRYVTVSGALTGNRNLITPNDWEGIIFNNTTGAFTLTVKTSGGSGIVVAQTKRAILFADGTNVVRITADV
jgi:hypothetical protein